MTRLSMAAAMILAVAMTEIALISLTAAESQAQTSCLRKLVPCFATLNTTTKPSKVCCDSAKKELRCLCTIITTPRFLAQFNVTVTEALNLSRRCDVDTDLSRCYAFGPEASSSPYPALRTPSPKVSFPPRVKSSWRLRLIIGASTVSAIIIIIVVVLVLRACNERIENARRKNTRVGGFNRLILLKEYTFADIKKMTKSFSHSLGEGGFAIVHKGKLPGSGRDVAVKKLKNAKEDKEQFKNELQSLSLTSHANIVPLLGFCFEDDCKALVCDYMPNGSLEQLIRNHRSTMMEWEMSYATVLGVSRGLDYLHNVCIPRIVHFDIKPGNILLDRDFRPKIADFGLAKLCKDRESVMSMQCGEGSFGYMAPEVASGGENGYKADVYSFGMVIFEIIGLRNRDKAAGSNNSSTHFPHWIYEDVERGETVSMFGDQITEEEERIGKKLVLVALWCIQNDPSDRPKMTEVVKMLEGDVGDIQAPPRPVTRSSALRVVQTLQAIDEMSSFSPKSVRMWLSKLARSLWR